MNYVFGNAVVGLPALIGVILGLKLYVGGRSFALYPTALLVISAAALILARCLIRKYPRMVSLLLELWVLSAISVTAFATAFVTWISLDAPFKQIFDLSSLDAEAVKTISAAFIAAVSTYTALIWTKDIGDAKGVFWPSTQFKLAMRIAYDGLTKQPAGTSVAFQAMFQDVVEGSGNIGWGWKARRIRSKILAEYIRATGG